MTRTIRVAQAANSIPTSMQDHQPTSDDNVQLSSTKFLKNINKGRSREVRSVWSKPPLCQWIMHGRAWLDMNVEDVQAAGEAMQGSGKSCARSSTVSGRKSSVIGCIRPAPLCPGGILLAVKAAISDIVADESNMVTCSIQTQHPTQRSKAELSVTSEMENIQN